MFDCFLTKTRRAKLQLYNDNNKKKIDRKGLASKVYMYLNEWMSGAMLLAMRTDICLINIYIYIYRERDGLR